ncbi:unnamed protein product [Sphagnum balticum]
MNREALTNSVLSRLRGEQGRREGSDKATESEWCPGREVKVRTTGRVQEHAKTARRERRPGTVCRSGEWRDAGTSPRGRGEDSHSSVVFFSPE